MSAARGPVDAAPEVVTGTTRYDWQIMACHAHPGVVLNVGCNEDPAKLRKRFGSRVVNCDLEGWDHHMDRPNHVDRIFNCLKLPWPCEDDEADCVIFGDILEHFTEPAIESVLHEARRVARAVAITVPEDTRIDPVAAEAAWHPDAYNLHTTILTEELLKRVLKRAGWHLTRLHRDLWGIGGDWGPDGLYGWCALAERAV